MPTTSHPHFPISTRVTLQDRRVRTLARVKKNHGARIHHSCKIRSPDVEDESFFTHSATTGPDVGESSLSNRVASVFTTLFPLWIVMASAIALFQPAWFSGLTSPSLNQGMLSVLMLSTGLTLSPADFARAVRNPKPILFAFFACYALMPMIALVLVELCGLKGRLRVGLLLLAIVSGGQASNLCTHIAGGDTALSVTMTATTTLAASIMLPVLSSGLLDKMVVVERMSLAITTCRVTFLPIVVGAFVNQIIPRFVDAIRSWLPLMGIIAVIVLVLGPVAQCAGGFAASWKLLMVPVLMLHLLGGVIGFAGPAIVGSGWTTAVTTAFETAFKSPVLSYVLAKSVFPPGVELASVVSIVVLAPLAALFAVLIRSCGRKSEK